MNVAKKKATEKVIDKLATARGLKNEAKTIKKEGLTKNNKTYTAIDPVTKKPTNTKPDAIGKKTVDEIKDVKRLSNSRQIRTQREVAKSTIY